MVTRAHVSGDNPPVTYQEATTPAAKPHAEAHSFGCTGPIVKGSGNEW